ncbi:MAG: hypothetical protein K0R90_860, partial [Oscillospiraceae bacterium]|nr:hypothetical protein [Oscillospiraceae bacterium]
MKVFNACCIIIKRRAASFAIYFIIFISLSVIMTSFSADQYNTDFSEIKPNFTVINRDEDTALTKGLTTYLKQHGTEVVLKDQKDALQDATFYHASDYILILPKGFGKSFFKSEVSSLQTVTTPDSAKGYYMDSLANQYLNLVRTYETLNPNMDKEVLVSSVL